MDKATLQLGGDNWAAKDSSLLGYAQGNISNKYIPREFTFTRASTATRINQNKLIEKSRENLLLHSNQFNTTWQTVNGGSVTGGQTGYDGSNDGWLLESTVTGSSFVRQLVDVSSSVSTLSIYAKSGNVDWCFINAVGVTAYYDLSNGIVGTTTGTNLIDTNIESVGNGWYRISITGLGISQERIYPATTNGNPDSAVGDNIYIQDAQLEQGLVATDYIETTTSTVSTGIVENLPRIDYSSGTPALLLEPQRTNSFKDSEDFTNWIQSQVIVSTNATISPDGTQNASKIIANTTTGNHAIYRSLGATISGGVVSIFAKAGEYDNLRIIEIGNFHYFASFDLTNGNVSATGGLNFVSANTTYFGNGWYRCEIVTNKTSFGAPSFIGFPDGFEPTNATANYPGDGVSGIYIWGAQAEAGSYPTSYIPTYGTSVTRTIDDCFLTNAQDLIGQTEGTLYCEFLKSDDSAYTIVEINLNDSTNNRLMIYVEAFNTRIQILLVTGGVQQFNDYFQYPISNRNKIALTYTNNNFKLFVNGSLEWTSTSGTLGSSYNYVALRDNNLSSRQSKTVNVITFPTILTDAKCITLTTI